MTLNLANVLTFACVQDRNQLAFYAKFVFDQQPTRRLFHAFYMCSSYMELFVFDRAGAYSSGKFSIHDEPDKFARAIVGYLTMTHEDMGIDTFIKRLSEDVISLCDTAGKETKLTLEQLLSTSRRTTCFSTENYAKVVKFSWTSEGGAQEADLLILAEERGVKGVPRLVAYNRKTSIAELRQDLEFPRPKLNKRKLPALLSDSDSGDDCHRYKWRRCSDWEMPGEYDGPPPGLTESSEKPFINKIYNCLVVAPYGRPISNFESAMELLESMRDPLRQSRDTASRRLSEQRSHHEA